MDSFQCCDQLTTINFPASLEAIEMDAFGGCELHAFEKVGVGHCWGLAATSFIITTTTMQK